MPKTIEQTVELAASPAEVFDTYLDSHRHAEVIGMSVDISAEEGQPFSAFEGQITGRNLLADRRGLIVQAWRAGSWPEDATDSVLTFVLDESDGGTRVTMVHANVPDSEVDSITEGWNSRYWEPWKQMLG